jgi:hypothetical protein
MSQSREAFEADARARDAGCDLFRDDHRYLSRQTQLLWQRWQAAWECARSLLADLARSLSRRTDPQTSKDAAAQAGALRERHHAIIVECLRTHGSLGKDGIAARTRLDGVAVCRRLGELQALGLIRLTGKTVQSASGRAERQWEAVE